MSQADALVFAASGTVVLLLATRALNSRGLSLRSKAWMALAWAILIIAVAGIASWLHP